MKRKLVWRYEVEVKVAKTAGFCFGVERAVQMVYEQIQQNQTVYTFGPIIHNEEVVSDLQKRGVKVVHTKEQLSAISEGSIIIRSHGVSNDIYQIIQEKGLQLIDATCPFVKKIHNIVKEKSKMGYTIIIIGNPNHPEVEGIKGWCMGTAIVIQSKEDAKKLEFLEEEKVCVVSQTTFNYKKFKDIVEILTKKRYDILALNTICNATEERQMEARTLSKSVDAMIVIGGTHSSNTQKLYEICKKECDHTYYIQTLVDLDLSFIESFCSVGITAGASTPNNIIKEVQTACQK